MGRQKRLRQSRAKILLIYAIAALLLVINAFPTKALAGTLRTQDEAVTWANARASERWNVDVDGAYGVQCVDLILAYYEYLTGWHTSGNAIDYTWNTLPEGWSRVGSPQAGDVVVWNKGVQLSSYAVGGGNEWANSTYGHIGIVVDVRSDRIITVETNTYYGGTPAIARERLTAGVACFIRPNFIVPQPIKPTYRNGSVTTISTSVPYVITSAIDDSLGLAWPPSGTNGGVITLDERNDNNVFYFVDAGNGTYGIRLGKREYNDYIHVANCDAGNGSKILNWQNYGNDNSLWWVEKCADGSFAFRNRGSDRYIDVPAGTATKGAALQQYEGNGTASQKFYLRPMSRNGTVTSVPEDEWFVLASLQAPNRIVSHKGGDNPPIDTELSSWTPDTSTRFTNQSKVRFLSSRMDHTQ